MELTVQIVKDNYPEIYAAIHSEGVAEGEKGKVDEARFKALETRVETLSETNKKLEKEVTITKANLSAKEEQIKADSIFSTVMASDLGASVAEAFHPKIRNQVDHTKFRTAEGAFDATAYQTALEAEVADWAKNLAPATGKVGLTEKKDDTVVTTDPVLEARSAKNKETLKQMFG